MLIRARVWVDGPVLYSRRTLRLPAAGPARPAPQRVARSSTTAGAASCGSPAKDGTTCASTPPTCGSSACTRRWRSSSGRSTASRTTGYSNGSRSTASASGSARRGTGTARAGRRGSATWRGRARWGSRGSEQRGFETTCALCYRLRKRLRTRHRADPPVWWGNRSERHTALGALTATTPPCGSAITALRKPGASVGGISSVPPPRHGALAQRVHVVDAEVDRPVRRDGLGRVVATATTSRGSGCPGAPPT